MSKNKLRMPDGTETYDDDLFSAEWQKVFQPFEDLGFKVAAFSPGLVLVDSKDHCGHSFEVPLWAARRIGSALRNKAKVKVVEDKMSRSCIGCRNER